MMTGKKWFTYSVVVQYHDLDSAGHVNNAVYLHYLEDARMYFLRRIYGRYDIPDLNIVLASLNINFRAESGFGDTLVVRIRLTEIGNSSWTFYFEILDKRTKWRVCDGESVQVMFDYKKRRKMMISPGLRKRLEVWM